GAGRPRTLWSQPERRARQQPSAPPGIVRAPGATPAPWFLCSPAGGRTVLVARGLEGVVPAFAGADADDILHREDGDLAVADGAGPRGALDGVDHRGGEDIVH